MFLQNLRTQTSSSHKTLEQNPLSFLLMQDAVEIGDYVNYLKKLYGFVKGFEENVFPILQNTIPDIDRRKKTYLLENDLLAQHQDLQLIEMPNDEIFHQNFNTEASAWGGMYVLEGSTLGGQIINRHLQKKLGDIIGQSDYFRGYGAETGTAWKSFLESFCMQAKKSSEQEQEIIRAAIKTFDLMDSWLKVNINIETVN
jgi:heme oxygenase (biliverdin-IX-beta and delta-forming)